MCTSISVSEFELIALPTCSRSSCRVGQPAAGVDAGDQDVDRAARRRAGRACVDPADARVDVAGDHPGAARDQQRNHRHGARRRRARSAGAARCGSRRSAAPAAAQQRRDRDGARCREPRATRPSGRAPDLAGRDGGPTGRDVPSWSSVISPPGTTPGRLTRQTAHQPLATPAAADPLPVISRGRPADQDRAAGRVCARR